MVAISRSNSFRRHQQPPPFISLRWTLQAGIVVAVGLFYFMAYDASIVDQLFSQEAAIQRSLASGGVVDQFFNGEVAIQSASASGDKGKELFAEERNEAPHASPTEAPLLFGTGIFRTSLEEHLQNQNVTEAGRALVRSYDTENEDQPLRHFRFEHLILPEVKRGSPVIQTAYVQSTVITQAPWFPHQKDCQEKCCAQAVAISLKQDEHRIINAVDGLDLAELQLYGNSMETFHIFHASELNQEVIPCLKPGVIIHADSYRGPITRFFREHRPKMTVPYVFITSKTDGETPITFFTHKLDEDPLLLAWYGINPSYRTGANHSKFRMMPLGLAGNKYRQHPDLDLLMQARNYSNPFGGDKSRWTNATLWLSAKDTTPLLFVKFGLHEFALHREVPFEMACGNRTLQPLDNVSCNKGSVPSPRQTYAASSKYLFGLSPPGNGQDCYRTYELLLNGLIPIVMYQPEYEELFEGLPLIQLRHWNYTQQELVNVMREYIFSSKFLNNTFDEGWKRLFLQHWRHQVLKDAGRLDERITDPDGNQYFKAWQYSLYRPPYIQHATPELLKIIKRKEREKRKAEEEKARAKEKTREQVIALKEEQEKAQWQPRPEQQKDLPKGYSSPNINRRQRDRRHQHAWNGVDSVIGENDEARQREGNIMVRRKLKQSKD